jgi:KUP system potassium uptake protein
VYQSIGVIYGDIGTSPLYVYSSTFTADPSYDDLLGALSLIIWTLTLIVTIKYCLVVLRADDEGQGGTFALYSLLSRYSNITHRDPKEARTIKMERYLSTDIGRPTRTIRDWMERSHTAQRALKLLAIFGVCLVMADGILTPAQSVLGAIQGLTVVKPDLSTSAIIGISCAILVLLFLIQPFGTTKIASLMAPVIIIWLLFNAAFGIYNLVKFDHSVLKAFSPYFAGHYLVVNKTNGWKSLGGILLAFTGCEALFADLGAFNAKSIQLSWIFFGYPTLLLAYTGQAAYISQNPGSWSNPFFNTVPPGMFWPSLVIAVLAAIVASQAMITATFQLIAQVIHMSYFPKIKVVHTSDLYHGQIYVPSVNWVLMVGTVIVTAVYHNTTKLGEAYGTCVVLVTLITTCMVSVCAIIVWRINPFIVLFVFLIFASLDGLYLSAALIKVPDGAWFTLMIAAVLASFILVWRFGKESQWHSERGDKVSTTALVCQDSTGQLFLTEEFGGKPLTKISGVGIFFDKAGDMSPLVFAHFLQKFYALHEIIVFFHLQPLPLPSVPEDDQYRVTRTTIPNCYRIVVRHGYKQHIVTRNLADVLKEKLLAFVSNNPLTEEEKSRLLSIESKAARNKTGNNEADLIESEFSDQTIYVLGKEQLKIPHPACSPRATKVESSPLVQDSIRKTGKIAILHNANLLWRSIVLEAFIFMRELTRGKVAEMDVPVDRVVEIGFIKEL